MKKIALIGAGELGSRHLQSLAKCSFPVSIQVVDPSEKSLEVSRKRFNEITTNYFVEKIDFIHSISELDNEIDLTIIATSSDVRLNVLKELLEKHKKQIKNLLLEKVLFQSSEELDEALHLIKTHKVDAWVNCPKRSFESIKKIKALCTPGRAVNCRVSGTNWGLLCNSIHFIDMMAYLLESTNYEIFTDGLIKKIHHSKREGFIEMFGTLKVNFGNRGKLELVSNEGDAIFFTTRIETNQLVIHLDERSGKLEISHKDSGQTESLTFRHPYQSEMTSGVAYSILFANKCELTSIEESASLHRPFLTSLIDVYEQLSEGTKGFIPIT